jgi:hypothetical protein
MSTEAPAPIGNMGAPVPRLDGRMKMTGAAPYALGAESKLFSENHYSGTSRLFATSLGTKAGAMPADDRLLPDDHRASTLGASRQSRTKIRRSKLLRRGRLGAPRRSAFNC